MKKLFSAHCLLNDLVQEKACEYFILLYTLSKYLENVGVIFPMGARFVFIVNRIFTFWQKYGF